MPKKTALFSAAELGLGTVGTFDLKPYPSAPTGSSPSALLGWRPYCDRQVSEHERAEPTRTAELQILAIPLGIPAAVCAVSSGRVHPFQCVPPLTGRIARGPSLTKKTSIHTFDAVNIEWDPRKADANLREQSVSFSEAATVLTDDFALTREDRDSVDERRFLSLGMSAKGALLVVVYTHREPDMYRLISAWKANKPQRTPYEKASR